MPVITDTQRWTILCKEIYHFLIGLKTSYYGNAHVITHRVNIFKCYRGESTSDIQ